MATPKLVACFVIVLAAASTACERAPSLEYKTYAQKLNPDDVPVIIVGQIIEHVDMGPPYPSRLDPRLTIQLRKVTVQVENVLRGDVRGKVVPVYYFNSNSSGPVHMGMLGHGGHWHVGDRIVWFLTWESGVLRTVLDTWADSTVTVLTGPHPDYKSKPNESYADQVIDILLDAGQRCDTEQWALGVLASTNRSSGFDLAYTVSKLRAIASNYTPEAREAALGELQVLSCNSPQYPDAAAGLCAAGATRQ